VIKRSNVIAPVFQVLVGGAVMLIVFRYLHDQIGIAQIGLWSLIVAVTSLSRLGELGLSAGLVRFISKAHGDHDHHRAAGIVQTVVLTLAVAFGLFALGIAPFLSLFLPLLVPQESVSLALEVMPVALISLWLMMMVSVVSGALDGCLKIDIRSYLFSVAQIGYLLLVLFLVPPYGLVGVAWAQVVQYGILLFALWWALRMQIRELPPVPRQWKWGLFREVFAYGIRFQAMTLVNMLFDPLVKVLMGRLGGLESLGYYELANNMILKFRAIIIEGSRVLVSTVARMQDEKGSEIKSLFLQAYQWNFFVATLCYGLIGIFTSLFGLLLLGQKHEMFIIFALILNIGWFANTIIGPSYFSNLGTGRLRDNIITHVILAIVAPVVGFTLGIKLSGVGVALGVLAGLIVSTLFLLVSHMNHLSLDWRKAIFPKNSLLLVVIAVVMTLTANFMVVLGTTEFMQNALVVTCGAVFVVVMLVSPSGRKILRLLGNSRSFEA
jgi:O-antigen/teichoic acid export membrane protein